MKEILEENADLIRKPTFHLVLVALLACISVIFHSCSQVMVENERERTKRHNAFYERVKKEESK